MVSQKAFDAKTRGRIQVSQASGASQASRAGLLELRDWLDLHDLLDLLEPLLHGYHCFLTDHWSATLTEQLLDFLNLD